MARINWKNYAEGACLKVYTIQAANSPSKGDCIWRLPGGE